MKTAADGQWRGGVKTQRLPIERRVPGGAAPGVLVWPFLAPFLYQGWLAVFAAASSPGLNGNLNAGIAALVSLSALESTLSGRSAWSSLKASATGGCVGEVMKAPGDAKESGPVSEPRKAAVYLHTIPVGASLLAKNCQAAHSFRQPALSLTSIVGTPPAASRLLQGFTVPIVGAGLLAMRPEQTTQTPN
ncbi:hypothetical protein EMIT0P44_40187 [Pseudomonas sp. IT-P44]